MLVGDLAAPQLDADQRHHLERVLRLRPGDALVLGDGAGRWRSGRLDAGVVSTGDVEYAEPDAPEITIAFALVKGAKPDLAVQKLTELGVDRIVPFRAARSVVRWDAAQGAKAVTRLRSVARAATQQCHRPYLPIVEDVTEFGDLLARDGAALADRKGGAPDLSTPVVLVGPEGGWAPEEHTAASARSVPRVALGPHVLRAETAAVTMGAALTALRAGLVGPAGTRSD